MKFPLKMADGATVRTVEDLREHFDLAAVLSYYENGRLAKWLENGYYDEEAEKVAALNSASGSLVEELCDILGVDHSVQKTTQVDLDDIAKRNQHLEQLKQITADDAILAAVDRVAFSQDDLSGLLQKGITEIYLYGRKFVIPEGFENNTYICLADSEIEFNCEIMRLQAAHLDRDDVYQTLAIRLIRAVELYRPGPRSLKGYIFMQLRYELLNCKSSKARYGFRGAPYDLRDAVVSMDALTEADPCWENKLCVGV